MKSVLVQDNNLVPKMPRPVLTPFWKHTNSMPKFWRPCKAFPNNNAPHCYSGFMRPFPIARLDCRSNAVKIRLKP